MQIEPIPLDPLSEMLALSTRANIKNLILSAVELKGNLNQEALVLSTQRAMESFPQLNSCLKETKRAGRKKLVWEFRPDLQVPFIIRDFSEKETTSTYLDIFLKNASDHLDKQWDLFTQLPIDIHIAKMAHNHHIFFMAIHHASADAGVASELGKEVFLNYHETITGRSLVRSCYSLATSTSSKRRARARKESWREKVKENLRSLTPMVAPAVLPAGTGDPNDLRQYHIKRVLSPEDSQRITTAAQKGGSPLLDKLVASAVLSVDEWNSRSNLKRGTITTSMTVNMRGRYSGIENPNSSGLLYFKFSPKDRNDPKTLARAISLARISQFRKQLDRKYYENVVRMNNLTSILPYRMRSKVTHFIAQKHQLSVALTLMGVIWPKDADGRPSTESCLTQVGGLDITEMHGLGYKLLSATHALLTVYIFANKLNIVLSASACHFTRDEAESFLDLIVEMLTPGQDTGTSD